MQRTRAQGFVEITGPTGSVTRETYTCCHCNGFDFVPDKNAAEVGFCNRCMARECVPCAKKLNGRCRPFEEALLRMEARGKLLAAAGILSFALAFFAHGTALAYGPRAGTVCVPGAATGTTWYACDCYNAVGAHQPAASCTPGNDGNAGTSPAAAFQTLDPLRTKFQSGHDGDRVAFCQGGVFQVGTSSSDWDNSSFTNAGGGGTVATYQASWGGAGVRPWLINPALCQNAIAFRNGGTTPHGPYMVADIGIYGLGNKADGCSQEFGIFFFGNEHDGTVCNVVVDTMQIGMSVARNAETDRVTNITLRDSVMQNNWVHGWLGGDTGTQILFNTFTNNGYSLAGQSGSILNHHIYLVGADGSDPTQPSLNMTVQGNDLYRATWDATDGCGGAPLTCHGLADGILVDGNHIHEDIGPIGSGCWGIALAPGYTNVEQLSNVTVRYNVVENVGNASIVGGSWVVAQVYDNVLVNRQSINDKAIDIPDNEGTGDAQTTGVKIYGNSILIDSGIGIRLADEGTNHGVNNNAIYHTGGGVAQGCLTLNLPSSAYSNGVDYNDCFIVGGVGSKWETSTASSLAAWQGATGFDTHSKTTDPAFLSLTLPYSLQFANTSPLFNAGSTARGSAMDILGVLRPQGPSTDIGAYELIVASTAGRPAGIYGMFGWLLLMVGAAALAGHLSVRRRKAERAELEDTQHVHEIDEHTILALREMGDDGISLMLNAPCDRCGEPIFLERQRRGKAT